MTGEEIKQKLNKEGYTITEIAKMLGMSQQNFSAKLSKEAVKTDLIEKLCEILNVDLYYFYGNSKYLPGAPQSPKEILHRDYNDGLSTLRNQLEEKDRQLHAKDVQIDNLMALLASERGIKVREAIAS